jgi:hypothetical protein
LIRRDLVAADLFAADDLAAVKLGAMSASDLASDVDGKLASSMLTAEGRAFSDYYYDTYIQDFSGGFRDLDIYSIVDDDDSRGRVGRLLDRRYAEWIAAERPAPDSDAVIPEYEPTPRFERSKKPPSVDEMIDGVQRSMAEKGTHVAMTRVSDIPSPHEAPELEQLIPAALKMNVSSVSAANWGDPKLRRALKSLGVSSQAAHVVNAMAGQEPDVRVVLVYVVPGVPPDRLDREFYPVVRGARVKSIHDRVVGYRNVHGVHAGPMRIAWWVTDGLVIMVSARDDATVDNLITRLP